VTDLEQHQQERISQLEAAMAQQTQNQIQCALHQQQQTRISDLEAEDNGWISQNPPLSWIWWIW
jgi:hypothetical protein